MGIKGINVVLHQRTITGYNQFKEPIYTEQDIVVEDCLVAPVSSDDIVNDFTLEGKKGVYNIAIPKGDNNDWLNAEVTFFGQRWKQFGIITQGIEENIPLRWNKKITVERYEQS